MVYQDQGPDEEAGDDGEEGAGDQLQDEAVQPDIYFVQQAAVRLCQWTPLQFYKLASVSISTTSDHKYREGIEGLVGAVVDGFCGSIY